MRSIVLQLLRDVGLYLAVVVGGTVVFLAVAPVAGYVPYGDTPPAGWRGEPFEASWGALWRHSQFMFEVGLFVCMYAWAPGVILHLLHRFLLWVRTPKLLLLGLLGVASAFLSAFLWLGLGWYFAMASVGVTVAFWLGLFFGVLVLPRGVFSRNPVIQSAN